MREMYMKLRFYMRGLGIGMMVTALLVTIVSNSGSASAQMSDEEIKARAAELGMVEDKAVVLSDLIDSSSVNNSAEAVEDKSASSDAPGNTADVTDSDISSVAEAESQSQETASKTDISQASESIQDSDNTQNLEDSADLSKVNSDVPATETSQTENNEQQTVPQDNAETSESSTVSFRIASGNTSGMVSRSLVEAGLVDDAVAFDKYLCDNGYSKALRVGTYEIPEGSSYEEIAKIITGKR
jgi:hypothetical protein